MLLLLLAGAGAAVVVVPVDPNAGLLIQEPDTVLTLETQLFGDGVDLP